MRVLLAEMGNKNAFFCPNSYGARGDALHISIRIKLDQSSCSKLGVNVGLVHLRFLKWL